MTRLLHTHRSCAILPFSLALTALPLSAQFTTDNTVGTWTAPGFETINGLRTFDVEGDGDQDIFLNRYNLSIQGTFSWYENTGQGVFAPPVLLHSADQVFPDVARDFDLADRDGDGDLDLVYVTELSSNIYVRTYDAGAFGPPEVWGALAANGRFIRWMQLNPWEDSLIDVVAHSISTQPSGLVNTGGAFGPSFTIGSGQAGLGPTKLEVGKFTDSYGDFVVLAGAVLHLYSQIDDGDGGHEWTMTVIGYSGYSFQVLDVDNDGDDDIGLAHQDTTAWLRSPGYLTALEYEMLNPAGAAGVFGHVDCDRYTDLFSLFYTDFFEPQISTGFDSDGNPNVTQPAAATGLPNTGKSPQALVDLDEDGLNDLLMVVNDTALHWYVNDGPEPSIATLPPLDTLCLNSSGYVLPPAEPSGGSWYGQGVDDGLFSAAGLGTGDMPVFYEALNAEQCPATGATVVRVIHLPSVTSTPDTWDACSFITLQFTGSPSGGEWTGPVDTSGSVQLTPGLEGWVYYNYTDVTGGTCTAIGGIIDMNTMTIPNISNSGPFCFNAQEYEVIPILVGNPGSISIWSWVDSAYYITPGSAQIFYLPDTLGLDTIIIGSWRPTNCPSIDTLIIEVIAPLEVTLGAFTDTLVNGCAGAYALTGGLPSGGVYSGDGVVDDIFNPEGLLGDIAITYTYDDGGGCSGSATRTIHVIEAVTVTPGSVDQCVSDVPVQLTTQPIPEVWFDAIVSSSGLLNTAQPFNGAVYCAWTDVLGCQAYGSVNVNLTAYSEGSVSVVGQDPFPEQICVSSAPFTIVRSLADGTMEDIAFDPATEGIGDYAFIGYAVDDGSGCLRNDTLSFSVVDAPIVQVQAFPDTLLRTCEESAYPLPEGSPAGGTWAGQGVVDNVFYPYSIGGNPTLTYTVDLGAGCAASDSAVVQLIDYVTFAPSTGALYRCVGDTPIQFQTTPAGAVWTAPATPDGYVDMLAAFFGVMSYTWTDATGCSSPGFSTEVVISDYTYGSVSIPDTAHVVCVDHPGIHITYSLGGSSVDTIFDPASNGPGTYYFTGFPSTQPGPTQCYQSVTDSVVVVDGAVTLDLDVGPLYDDGDPVILDGGSPEEGTYSGNGVTDSLFDPTAAGYGWHVITYMIDSGTCAGEAIDSVFVDFGTGIEALTNGARLQVWPVPAQDILQVMVPSHSGTVQLVLLDARGREVSRNTAPAGLTGRTLTLTTSSIANGTYTLFARGLANAQPARIIIAR